VRILFWGTPEFAVPSLRALTEEGHEVVGVVTQPDRPAGRGQKVQSSAVKRAALEEGITPVLTPEKPRGDEFMAQVHALTPDVSVVVAYGHILKPEVLAIPPHGSINVHASLLPELRGAAPINWAIARGHETTGVTIMRMVAGMDAGAILSQVEEPIAPGETATELTRRLSEIGAEALVETLALLQLGTLEEREQDHDLATFAPKVDRTVARITWTLGAAEVANHVRGMDEVPGAWTMLAGEPVKLFRPEPRSGGHSDEPGTVLRATPSDGLEVAAGSGTVAFGEVQPPGKRRMPAADWIRGRGIVVGARFE
jgi:methionyl-tRNA formyltransferase